VTDRSWAEKAVAIKTFWCAGSFICRGRKCRRGL